jgi:hypothetical protein
MPLQRTLSPWGRCHHDGQSSALSPGCNGPHHSPPIQAVGVISTVPTRKAIPQLDTYATRVLQSDSPRQK